MRLDNKYIDELMQYLESGQLTEDFENSPEERRYEILDFLEKIMDLGELADKTATEVIFKNSQLGALMGAKSQK